MKNVAPFVAALLIGVTMAAPAQAAVSTGNNGLPEQAQSAHSSAHVDPGGAAQVQPFTPGNGRGLQSAAEEHRTRGTASTRGEHSDGTIGATKQPVSNADRNDGGANGQCPDDGAYCARDRVEEPAPNGAGDGGAHGKPCAGCVGKADNKNPPGQQPDASDSNRGYECESPVNKGIGPGNPAHTGCQPAEPGGDPGKDCAEGTVMRSEDCETVPRECPQGDMNGEAQGCETPPRECPQGDMNGEAQGCETAPRECPQGDMNSEPKGCAASPVVDEPTESEVLGVEKTVTQSVTASVEESRQPQSAGLAASGALPRTGAGQYLTWLAVTGSGLAIAGALTLLFRRRLPSAR